MKMFTLMTFFQELSFLVTIPPSYLNSWKNFNNLRLLIYLRYSFYGYALPIIQIPIEDPMMLEEHVPHQQEFGNKNIWIAKPGSGARGVGKSPTLASIYRFSRNSAF
jgi:hypothetical protein